MKQTTAQLRFLLLFAAIYAAFHFLYFQIPDRSLAVAYQGIINKPAAFVINHISAEAHVKASGNRLSSPRAVLEIVRGCDGSGVFFIVTAAILASGAALKRMLVGLGTSALLVYGLNQLRVIGLYFVVAHRPEWFTALHTYYVPTLLIVIVCIFFAAWLNWAYRDVVTTTTAA